MVAGRASPRRPYGVAGDGPEHRLAQSPQFYKQTMARLRNRPVFRAEPHDTPRHLNEYVFLDAEMGFIVDHTTVMDVLTAVIHGMVAAYYDEAAADVSLLDVVRPEAPPVFPVIHFADALNLIEHATGEVLAGELDLAPAHERWLGEWAKRTHGSDFLYVVGFPTAKRPFYTHPDPRQHEFANGFDLLFRGLELVTGSQRLHRSEDYLAALEARGLDPAPFAGYVDAFTYGMPPHGGFAIGLERWVARLVGAENIRETTLFPRDLHRLTP